MEVSNQQFDKTALLPDSFCVNNRDKPLPDVTTTVHYVDEVTAVCNFVKQLLTFCESA